MVSISMMGAGLLGYLILHEELVSNLWMEVVMYILTAILLWKGLKMPRRSNP